MTPQPQQEYIISEEMVQCIEAWTGRYPTASKDIVETIRSHPHTPNPCEEQGCTDIHDCDEICEHQRMYTPAWVKQHDKAIRKAERERVLEVVDIECQEIQSRIESSAMGNPLSERERGRIIGILDIRVKLDSLRGVNHD